MASSTSLVFNLIGRDRTGQALASARKKLESFGKSAANIVAGMAVAEPALAVIGAAAAGLAAGAAAAGMAVGAFSAAATPQLAEVTDAWTLYEKAQKAAAEGGAGAKAAQDELNAALAKMAPATRETAVSFFALKKGYKSWSDSLASTTMPVFTKAFKVMRDLLPTMTPFVKAAAGAFSDLMDRIAKGIKSAGFKEWIGDFATASGPALRDFIAVIGNLAKGFGGLLQAFLPHSKKMTGGLREITAAFAEWGTGLKGSEGFKQFMAYVNDNGPKLWETLGNIAKIIGTLIMAVAPFTGLTMMVVQALSQLLALIPPEVVTTIMAVALAFRIFGMAVTALNFALSLTPLGWIVIGIAALILAIVWIATKTTWFQTIWRVAWSGIKSFVSSAISGIKTAIAWFGSLPGKFSGWFNAAKNAVVSRLTSLVSWVRSVPGRIISALSSLAGRLRTSASNAFQAFRTSAASKASSLIGWVRGLPGRIASGIGSLKGLLVNKGADVIRGLWNGIKRMGGWLKSQLINFAKSMIPGPIAKALGIGSPSKLMADKIGRWIPAGVVQGIERTAPVLDRTMTNLVQVPARPVSATPAGPLPGTGSAGQVMVTIRLEGGDSELKRRIQKMVRVDGRGSVVTAFETR